jgi:hypothetical protein
MNRYIEVVGQSGAGKSTILFETQKQWSLNSTWILPPPYNISSWEVGDSSAYDDPRELLESFMPSKKYMDYNSESVAEITERFCKSKAKNTKRKAGKLIPPVFISYDLWVLEQRAKLHQDKALIIDEGLVTRLGWLIDPWVKPDKKLLRNILMPSAIIWVNTDIEVAVDRLMNRKKVARGHVGRTRGSIVSQRYKYLRQEESTYQLLSKHLPFMEISGQDDPRVNAAKIIDFTLSLKG